MARRVPRVQRGPRVLLAGLAVGDGGAPPHHPGLQRPGRREGRRAAGARAAASSGGLYQVYRDPEVESRELWGQGQWALLRKLVEERKPATIGVNISHTHAFSDGLSAGEREQLEAALGPWTSRVVRAERLPLDYVSLRLPEMLPHYRQMMQIVHALIARAFSSEVITPGKTTNEDVVWWLRQRVNELGLGEWFPPSVSVQRPGVGPRDFGATADRSARRDRARRPPAHRLRASTRMGLATDTQHVGYVLKPGETRRARRACSARSQNSNRLQDLLLERMKPGPHRQRGAGRHARRDEGGRHRRDRLHASDRRPRSRRRAAHRALGPPGGRARAAATCRCLPSTWFSIELQATTRRARVETASRCGPPRKKTSCDRRERDDRLGARAADELPPGPLAGRVWRLDTGAELSALTRLRARLRYWEHGERGHDPPTHDGVVSRKQVVRTEVPMETASGPPGTEGP